LPADNGGTVTLGSTATEYTIGGLNPGEKYTITVIANNTDDPPLSSPGADAITVTTAFVGEPLDPANLAIVWRESTQIAFSWHEADANGGTPISDYAIAWTPVGVTGTTGYIDFGAGTSGYIGLSRYSNTFGARCFILFYYFFIQFRLSNCIDFTWK
jgi:hypothetical protein